MRKFGMLGDLKKGTLVFFTGDEIPPGFKQLKRLSRFGPPPWPNPNHPPAPESLSCDDLGIKVLIKK